MTVAEIDIERYLARIGVDAQTGPPTLELLRSLQLAHMIHVPFENLHVFHRRGVRTDVDWSYPKIVDQRRGGWCFELNGAFGALLRAIGFDLDYVSCRVWEFESKVWGPELDHLAPVVRLDGSRFLADVGFGDSCIHPLLLEPSELDEVPRRTRIDTDAVGFSLTELVELETGAIEWEPQILLDPRPRTLDEFTGRSRFLETDPSSMFNQKPFATRALDGTGSRITLRKGVLRRTTGTQAPTSEPVEDDATWNALLLEHFGMTPV